MSEVPTQNSYNLPSGYDDNRIVLLARDPHWLFAYWEISSNKKNTFLQEFGHQLWERSIPVLKVTNVSKNTNFFIRVNEFSSNWYINVEDSGCLYVAELGRRVSDEFFINLASSNYIATPNETVSSNSTAYFVNYKDLKSGKLDLDERKIYETYNLKLQSQSLLGPSSPELFRMSLEESFMGVSSAELFCISLHEHLGISSESFMNWK